MLDGTVLTLVTLLLGTPVAESAPDLVGEYYSGDGLGMNMSLSIKADGRYSFAWDGCLGRYAQSEGAIRAASELLVLAASNAIGAAEGLLLPSRLLIVRWGDRLYLVPEDKGPLFAAHVVRGHEPRVGANGWFMLRRSDWDRPARGLPDVRPEWQKWLLRAPVEARVTCVLARHRAEIDAGSNEHLHPGLLLNLVSNKYGPSDVRVVSVRAGSSTIENDYGDPPMEMARRVTSKAR